MKITKAFFAAGMACLLLTMISACVTDRNTLPDDTEDSSMAQAAGHDHIEDDLAELCATDEAATDPELIDICRQLAARFYKDTVDGGSNVFEPGCHRVYRVAGCPALGALFRSSGDLCQSNTRLAEWTNAGCHPAKPVDSSKFDCDAECRRIGADAGVCVTLKNFCAANIDSAKCECVFL